MHYFKNKYILFFVTALTIFFFSTANGLAKSFQINDIEISKPFENNFDKNKVIDIGFKDAFSELMQILLKSSDYEKMNKVRLNEIKSMVESFSIKEEKFIDEIYYVKIGVTFDKKKIFNFLEKKNIFPSQIFSEKFLFIPIIIDENINNLTIYSGNPIYDNWISFKKKHHLINYILPTEDLEDLTIIKKKYNEIENYNFKEIINKYYLDNCIITLIFVNNQDVRVLSKIITKNDIVIKNNTFSEFDLNNEDKVKLLIDKLRNIYEDIWKENNQINTSIKLPLIVRVDNKKSNELIKFENILNELDLVNYFAIKKFNQNQIFYEIVFNGTPSNFIDIMRDRNYIFNTQKKIWILK